MFNGFEKHVVSNFNISSVLKIFFLCTSRLDYYLLINYFQRYKKYSNFPINLENIQTIKNYEILKAETVFSFLDNKRWSLKHVKFSDFQNQNSWNFLQKNSTFSKFIHDMRNININLGGKHFLSSLFESINNFLTNHYRFSKETNRFFILLRFMYHFYSFTFSIYLTCTTTKAEDQEQRIQACWMKSRNEKR